VKGGTGDAEAGTMKLNIETFSNIKGGNSFYKAVTHPLAARAVPRLLARIGDRKLALYDPQGLAEGFAEFYGLNELRLVGSFVQDVAAIGKPVLGRSAAALAVRPDGKELAVAQADGTVRVWEGGEDGSKNSVAVFEIGCPATSVAWSADGQNLYIGALDNEIHVYDLRKGEQVYALNGHTETPTSLALSPNGSYLLSPSFSSHTIIHDVRPFSPSPSRIHRVLQGAPAGFENTLLKGAWSKEDGGQRVAVGGADRMVCVWDVDSGRVLYKVRVIQLVLPAYGSPSFSCRGTRALSLV